MDLGTVYRVCLSFCSYTYRTKESLNSKQVSNALVCRLVGDSLPSVSFAVWGRCLVSGLVESGALEVNTFQKILLGSHQGQTQRQALSGCEQVEDSLRHFGSGSATVPPPAVSFVQSLT